MADLHSPVKCKGKVRGPLIKLTTNMNINIRDFLGVIHSLVKHLLDVSINLSKKILFGNGYNLRGVDLEKSVDIVLIER